MACLGVEVDTAPAASTSHLPQIRASSQKKMPAPSGQSMRAHMLATRQSRDGTVEIVVEAVPVGVTVKGREVVRVVAASQAERLGVKEGWKISHVNGEEMP